MKTKTERTLVLRIGGMTCVNCQNRIEKKLRSTVGIEDAKVNFSTGTATVSYNTSIITLHEIADTIEKLDYQVLDESSRTAGANHQESKTQVVGILVIILALYMLIQHFGIGALAGAFPLAEAGMGYGMLFIIGLITSVHCVAMCGGINLSQCIPAAALQTGGDRFRVLLPGILYNTGRIISYTAVGMIAGGLGSVVSITGPMQGIVQLAAGVFMVIMGINMLGIFPRLRRFNLHLPKIFAKKIEAEKENNKNPLFIGLLNGFMPCGPLQAMQLYALSTGSPVRGGFSMLLFSLGTVPLMFGIGALSSVLSKKFTAGAMKIGAILVVVLGLTMFSNGWSLGGFSNFTENFSSFKNASGSAAPSKADSSASPFEPVVVDGVQLVNSTLSAGRYPAITVQAGIPVKWTINAPQGSINGCNNRMIIREYGIEHRFKIGENLIEFTPERIGKFSYSCWMGMIRSSITVTAEGETAAAVSEDIAPVPAGVIIPTSTVAVAEIDGEGTQTVKIDLRDDGINPSIIIMEKFRKTAWIINNDSLDAGNSSLIFPLYSIPRYPIKTGENTLWLLPSQDFEFSTSDNVYYGYVKVVDDINNLDIDAIKREVAEFETLIYPDAYFNTAD
ncbi:MAG: sulfite exporter TauE/SafE family protein [Treponema sp.]|nr:sulfite exporter TauE/SafE family protein [Treponema sp.]